MSANFLSCPHKLDGARNITTVTSRQLCSAPGCHRLLEESVGSRKFHSSPDIYADSDDGVILLLSSSFSLFIKHCQVRRRRALWTSDVSRRLRQSSVRSWATIDWHHIQALDLKASWMNGTTLDRLDTCALFPLSLECLCHRTWLPLNEEIVQWIDCRQVHVAYHWIWLSETSK